MKDKNTLSLDQQIAARNIRMAEQNRKAAETALKNLVENAKAQGFALPICIK